MTGQDSLNDIREEIVAGLVRLRHSTKNDVEVGLINDTIHFAKTFGMPECMFVPRQSQIIQFTVNGQPMGPGAMVWNTTQSET